MHYAKEPVWDNPKVKVYLENENNLIFDGEKWQP
jgi:hypothetical protein